MSTEIRSLRTDYDEREQNENIETKYQDFMNALNLNWYDKDVSLRSGSHFILYTLNVFQRSPLTDLIKPIHTIK